MSNEEECVQKTHHASESDSEEEFYDAKSSDENDGEEGENKEIEISDELDSQLPPCLELNEKPTGEPPDVVPKIIATQASTEPATQENQNEASQEVQEEAEDKFRQPQRPPRKAGKKKAENEQVCKDGVQNTSTTSASTSTSSSSGCASSLLNSKNGSPLSNVTLLDGKFGMSASMTSSGVSLSHPMTLSSLLEDIVSIKGDLSVSEAILSQQAGDRRSVHCGENVDHCEKSRDNQISRSTLLNAHRNPQEHELLNQIMILNIDTGERVPLSKAEELLPKCLNPLSLHLMKLTNEFTEADIHSVTSDTTVQESLVCPQEEDEDNDGDDKNGETAKERIKKRMKNLKKIGSDLMKGVKGVNKPTKEGPKFHVELQKQLPDVEPTPPCYKMKINHKRGSADFDKLRLMQELSDCRGAIWCMKWSVCGQLLAVAGQDHFLRVYCCHKSWKYFTNLRNKASGQQVSPNSTKERDNKSFSSQRSDSLSSADNLKFESASSSFFSHSLSLEDTTLSEEGPLLLFSVYRGHTADVLDISWSKNHFLLSSSMDKTVRLWHITRVECLCTFRHIDFVTTIQFHPRDDRYFLSGSLDGKLRLWNIPDKRVTLWNEVMALPAQQSSSRSANTEAPAHGLITASAFVQNGKFAVIGTYDGRIIFYSTDQLKYFTQLHVNASSKNANNPPSSSNDRRRRKNNNKVTGIESVNDTKILITTNDSRLRLYDLRDLSLACKFKGCVNVSSQIKASISHDSRYIVCGSENASFYIWRLQDNTTIGQRRDRNHQWECFRLLPTVTTHTLPQSQQNQATAVTTRTMPGIVTSAIFAPVPAHMEENAKYVIATADFNGTIRIFAK